MEKQREFIDYVRTYVTVRYCKYADATIGPAHWAMDALRQAYEVSPQILEVLSAFQAAMQFNQLLFEDQRAVGWKAPTWLLDEESASNS